MTDDSAKWVGPQRRKWWRLYVHDSQKKGAAFLGSILFVYTFMVFFLALVGPYDPSRGGVVTQSTFAERTMYAVEFLMLGQTIWPAIICILIPATVIFSLYLTHRIAGPLYRFEQSALEFQQGNLALRISVRKGDELKQLAEKLNRTVENFEQALVELRDREAVERKALHGCLETMKAKQSPDQGLVSQLEVALKEGEHFDAVLKKFRFSTSTSRPSI